MRHYLQKSFDPSMMSFPVVSGVNVTSPTAGLVTIRSPLAGTLVGIRVGGDVLMGTAIFNVVVDGSPLFSGAGRPKLGDGADPQKTVDQAVSIGSLIRLDLESPGAGGVWTPISLGLIVEDDILELGDLSGAEDTEALVFDEATGTWIPGVATGGGGGGGGIGTDVFSVDVPYGTPSSEDEEFTDGTLDSKWTVRNSLPYTLVDDHFFKPAANSANLGAIHQPWTPTANRSWVMKISIQPIGAGAGNWIGFFFRAANAGGYTRRSLAIRYSAASLGVMQSIWSDANAETFTSGVTTQITIGSPIYLRADYDHASLNLLFYISRDGMTWHFLTSTTAPGGQFPLSAAPTEVGIASWGTAPTNDIKVDWLRAIQGSTVGGSITGLQGLQGDTGPAIFGVAASDETSDLTTGTAKVIMHSPAAFTVGSIWAGLSTASSSGAVEINVKKNGTTIFTTNITVDATEKTSLTAAIPAVLSGALSFVIGDEIQIDIVAAGTGAKGLKVYFGE